MRIAKINHPKLNKGKDFFVHSPLSLDDLNNQLGEIFGIGHYKTGKRKKGQVMLDLGANIGMASIYFKDWAKTIYAFEPNPLVYKALLENVRKYKNIKCFNYGIGSVTQKDYLYGTDSEVPMTYFKTKLDAPSQVVQTITLEKFFKDEKIEHIDVMKIDVEGSEYLIFADKTFGRVADKIDFIVGEAHYANHGFPEVLPDMLGDYGYKVKFHKFKEPNLYRTLHYFNNKTGETKEYQVGADTIFTAEKK